MQLILNGINGRYLREITENASDKTDFVEAAVAYATESSLLFDWCLRHAIPLRFWGRFDETVPIKVEILRSFLSRRSPNFTCKILKHFHAKVIWWHGFGVYLGSANLTQAAWNTNIEAGCFFEEAELEATGIDTQLQDFFSRIDEIASPLTEELLRLIEQRDQELSRIWQQDSERQKKFLATNSVRQWKGLLSVGHDAVMKEQEHKFLEEWRNTLQSLRDIGITISDDQHRPAWLPDGIPSGAQADQFLHGYYYTHVIGEDRRSRFAEFYEANKRDPEAALREAMAWWHATPRPPLGEERALLEWGPFLRNALSADRILTLDEAEFEGICQRVWSIQDHARRVSNATLGLPNDTRHRMETKTEALAHFLYTRRAQNGSSVCEVINFVLYDGNEEDLPRRLWRATTDARWKIDHLGISALGELVGWAMPDRFPPRNNRTSKALRSLGYPVTVHG